MRMEVLSIDITYDPCWFSLDSTFKVILRIAEYAQFHSAYVVNTHSFIQHSQRKRKFFSGVFGVLANTAQRKSVWRFMSFRVFCNRAKFHSAYLTKTHNLIPRIVPRRTVAFRAFGEGAQLIHIYIIRRQLAAPFKGTLLKKQCCTDMYVCNWNKTHKE